MENDTHTEHTTPLTPSEKQKSKKEENFFVEIIRFTLVALLIVVPIRIFIAQPFIVQGSSMDSTFETGQYLIIDQVTYRFEPIQRGDVIVFRYPKDTTKFFIKRVIGIPGDTVKIDRDTITISNAEHSEGVVLKEPYVKSMRPDTVLTEKLGDHEFFVMGDNRDASSDSRVWGVLREDLIIGRVLVRLLPLSEIGILPGKFTQTALSTSPTQ